MTNLIIFEGCDNCGKTTIATALAKEIGYNYFKRKKEMLYIKKTNPVIIEEAHKENLAFFYEYCRQVDANVIVDRSFPSEYVYGSLFRQVDEKMLLDYDLRFSRLNTKIIILTKSDEFLEDELFSNEQLIQIKKKYVEYSEKTACDSLVLNTDDCDLSSQLKIIKNFLCM